MKLKALALSLLVSGAIPVIAQAGEYSNGDRVYAIFGRHESAAYVRGGNIVQAGDSNSKVEFDSCIPECYKWMSNYSLYGSKGKAQEIVKEMDEGHTSFTEGAGMAVGLLALLGLAAAMSDSEDSSDKSNYSSSKPDSKPVYSQDDGTGRMMYYRGDILELKYNGVKYNIPKDYYNNNKDKRKDLFRTLLNTESMEDDERQYWLYGLPTIGEDKVDRLTEILVTEEKN